MPFHVNVVIKTLRLFNKSVDLWDQFDPVTGKPVGHHAKYCREAATWLQSGKFSSLPIDVILPMAMTHVNAIQHRHQAHAVVDQLANVVSTFSPMYKKFRSRARATLPQSEHTGVSALNGPLSQ